MNLKGLPALNIQWPISEKLISGEKTIETRTYPIPEKYVGKELLFIETPGKKGKFKARTVGIIKFKSYKKYKNKTEFYQDFDKHKVNKESEWAWKAGNEKWGWEVSYIKLFKKPLPAPLRRGIVFTSRCEF